MKVFFKTNLLYNFHICKLNNLKVIDNLYSQCLTQTLSKTSSKSYMEGVYVFEVYSENFYLNFRVLN
jgi:hypothetical protein